MTTWSKGWAESSSPTTSPWPATNRKQEHAQENIVGSPGRSLPILFQPRSRKIGLNQFLYEVRITSSPERPPLWSPQAHYQPLAPRVRGLDQPPKRDLVGGSERTSRRCSVAKRFSFCHTRRPLLGQDGLARRISYHSRGRPMQR